MTDFFESYKREMAGHGIYGTRNLPVSDFFNGIHLEIPPETGRGWTEAVKIDNGLYISLGNYLLNQRTTGNLELTNGPLQFHILLRGTCEFRFGAITRQVSPGDIWVLNNLTGNIFRSQPSNSEMCGVTLTLPRHLVESWLGNVSCDVSRNLERLVYYGFSRQGKGDKHIFPLVRQMSQTNQIMCMAKNFFRFEKSTLYGKLHFESQVLDFLCRLLSLDFGKSKNNIATSWKIKKAVEQALDILQTEWENPPTISALARRVGINESYLKNGFRSQQGCTIGEFVRRERMKKALELIESGKYSVLETALFVGYANPSHFAAVFKRFYGHLPSYYSKL